MAFRLPRLPKDLSLVNAVGRASVEFQRWWQSAMVGIESILLDLQEAIDRITTNETDITALQAVTFTAGNGLTGGGNILTSPAFAVGAGTGIVVNADTVAVSAVLAAYSGGDTPSAFTLSIVDSVDAAAWRGAIGAGTSSTTGTVTSVAMTVPTGFSVSGSPVTTSGTLAISYAAGYQGFTSAESTKLTAITLGGNFTTSGAFNLTLTLTAATNVTLPTTGTLATLAGSETLSNKTLTTPIISGTPTYPGSPGTTHIADTSGAAVSLAASATVTFANFAGQILVGDGTTGGTGLYLVGGGAISTVAATTTIGGSFAFSGGAYVFTNTSGGTRTFSFASILIRAAA